MDAHSYLQAFWCCCWSLHTLHRQNWRLLFKSHYIRTTFSEACCPSWLADAVIKQCPNPTRQRKAVFHVMTPQVIIPDWVSQGRNLRQALGSKIWSWLRRNASYWLVVHDSFHLLSLACFIIWPRPTFPGLVLHKEGWGLQCKSIIKKIPDSLSPNPIRQAITQLRSPLLKLVSNWWKLTSTSPSW